MKYWVNVNFLKGTAVIHSYYCQRADSCPKDPALDNERKSSLTIYTTPAVQLQVTWVFRQL